MLRNVAGLVTRSGGATRRPSRKAPAGGAPDLAATPASRESPPKRRPVAIVIDFHIIETMKSNDAIDTLGALASEARLAVYRLLVRRGPEGYTPSELVARLEVPAPTLSFHLKGLVQAGLIISRREGRNLYYSPNFERMNALVGFLTENCCSLAGEACGLDREPSAATAVRRKSP